MLSAVCFLLRKCSFNISFIWTEEKNVNSLKISAAAAGFKSNEGRPLRYKSSFLERSSSSLLLRPPYMTLKNRRLLICPIWHSFARTWQRRKHMVFVYFCLTYAMCHFDRLSEESENKCLCRVIFEDKKK